MKKLEREIPSKAQGIIDCHDVGVSFSAKDASQVADAFLRLLDAAEQVVNNGFQSAAANGVLMSAVKAYRGKAGKR